MLERVVKFFIKIILMIFTLFGVRFLLGRIGILSPLEWFVVMVCGMLGFYGVLVIVLFALILNLL